MNNSCVINVAKLINTKICVSTEDGQILHDVIAENIRKKQHITVSFAGVNILISAFLNVAIGQLYSEFQKHEIEPLLAVSDLGSDDIELLNKVIENAQLYFIKKEKYDAAWKDEVGDEE